MIDLEKIRKGEFNNVGDITGVIYLNTIKLSSLSRLLERPEGDICQDNIFWWGVSLTIEGIADEIAAVAEALDVYIADLRKKVGEEV